MFLKVMSDSRNISCNLDSIGQSDPGYFSQGRVRFFGCYGLDGRTHTPLLRRADRNTSPLERIESFLQCRSRGFFNGSLPSFTDQLVDSWHFRTSLSLL